MNCIKHPEIELFEDGECIVCSCDVFQKWWDKQTKKQISTYNERSGTGLDFDDFYWSCQAGEVEKQHLKGLKLLKDIFKDVEFESKEMAAYTQQQEIRFEQEGDLPF